MGWRWGVAYSAINGYNVVAHRGRGLYTHMCVNNTDPHLQNHTCICRWVEWKRQAQTMRKRGHWKGWRRRLLLFLGSGGVGRDDCGFFGDFKFETKKKRHWPQYHHEVWMMNE